MQAPATTRAAQGTRAAARAGALLLAVALGVVLAVYIVTLQAQAAHPERSDFFKFYASTRFLWEGRSIYAPVPADPRDAAIGRSRIASHAFGLAIAADAETPEEEYLTT